MTSEPAQSPSSDDSASTTDSESLDWDSEQSKQIHLAASRGQALPPEKQLHSTYLSAAMYGVRHHEDFAMLPEVVAACAKNRWLACARNARLIMSNQVPEMPDDPKVRPYCIWYPQVATEDTYREVARRYPDMRYQVGRACAVAGYTRLYNELDLLPDVSIAEEAQDNGSTAIFEQIVSQRTRFAVMNDYTREINTVDPRAGAVLNCDTAVRSLLGTEHQYFDITDDRHPHGDPKPLRDNPPLAEEHIPLLYSPLPLDLPPVANKDVLIHMAAYEGNVDRYARLRRPTPIKDEVPCIVRGIYHNTTFAKWWSLQLKSDSKRLASVTASSDIHNAVTARFIMNNDLSRVLGGDCGSDGVMPYLIWYPQWPRIETLAALAELRPGMRLQIAHTAIVADYQQLYDKLMAEGLRPSWLLWCEAHNHGHGPYYAQDLERRAQALGFDIKDDKAKVVSNSSWLNRWCTNRDKEPSDNLLYAKIKALEMTHDQFLTIYDDECAQANAAAYNLFICSPDHLKKEVSEQSQDGQLYLYHEYSY